LDADFETPDECYNHYIREHRSQIQQKVNEKYDSDVNSILGTYKRVNPSLQLPTLYKEVCCNEYDRVTITRYRTGCHKLKIQKGRLEGNDRDTRLCSCLNDIQTIEHILFACPLTSIIRQTHGIENETLQSFFNGDNYTRSAAILKATEKILRIA